jgi:hypothetical protein
MWSWFFCSLDQRNTKWITCPRLFVLCPSTVLKPNDSGHGSNIYALHQNIYTPNQCQVDGSSLFETHLVETPCNFGFSASNQICPFTNFQNEEGANPCSLTHFVYQSKSATSQPMFRVVSFVLAKISQNCKQWLWLLQQTTEIYLFYLIQRQTSGCLKVIPRYSWPVSSAVFQVKHQIKHIRSFPPAAQKPRRLRPCLVSGLQGRERKQEANK